MTVMGYTPNLDDKNSPYYYGLDSTYKPAPPKAPKTKPRPVPSPLLADDPELQGYGLFKKTPPTPQAPESTSPTGRDEPRTSPTGVPQTGTRTGPTPMKMEDLQQYLGKDVQIANPFLSNALPGTNDDGYSYGDAVAMGGNKAEAATIAGGGFVESTIDGSGTVETKMVQGSPNLVLSGTESAAPTGEKTNDINDPSTWDENYARRRAFLDADSSMAGLKAVQAQKGIVYAGDKYYMNTGKTGEDGNPVLEALEGKDAKQDVRAYMRGAQGAEDLKNTYIDKIQASGESLTSTAPENYISTEQSPIAPIDSTAQVDASQISDAPTLIDEVKPEYTDKDRTGRYNLFRRS